MNDMEEEIDRIEKISYMKINNHYNSQIAYTIKQGYTCIVYITRFEMKSALNARLRRRSRRLVAGYPGNRSWARSPVAGRCR